MSMRLKFRVLSLVGIVLAVFCACNMKAKKDAIYANKDFEILENKVIQGEFEAVAISDIELKSNYKSPADFISQAVKFKFSVNGWDNELPEGKYHQLVMDGNIDKTPIIKFGEQYLDPKKESKDQPLAPGTKVTFRVDMNQVLAAFDQTGFYKFNDGSVIYKSDFKGVFVSGNVIPLNWDFDNLAKTTQLQLKDEDGDGVYTLDLVLNKSEEQKIIATSWHLKNNISAFPKYTSSSTLANAVYNMSLDEMQNAIEADSTLRTGLEWAGVWTRDISYSIILSMAILQPKVAMISLMKKVKNQQIIQDTGTGGSYPVSSDRMIWAVAAWEVYKVTGDQKWLNTIYPIIKNSVQRDEKVVYDDETGLVRGESSFLDWREQTYPKWMQPADIYESENLGTNAVHYKVNRILAEMAGLMNDDELAQKHQQIATSIKNGINKYLWMPEKGYYGQFLYGRKYKMLSPRAEALGEALTVLFGIADVERAQKIIASTPLNNFGIPCIYPQIPNIPAYHNNAIWPFVQSYWALAAAKSGNQEVLLHSIASIYRPSALFLTNKENLVAQTGDYAGTVINSSNMLWSLSGNLSLVYKALFGINFESDRLVFNPLVPKALQGERSLKNFNFRGANLDIKMSGYGRLKSISLDGKEIKKAEILSSLKGSHTVEIVLDGQADNGKLRIVEGLFSPETPIVTLEKGILNWEKVEGANNYIIIKDGKEFKKTGETSFSVKNKVGEFSVIAADKNGVHSFASEPIAIYKAQNKFVIELEDLSDASSIYAQGYSGKGFIEISQQQNEGVSFTFNIKEAGYYALNFRYANGSGAKNTDNKCGIRNLYIDDKNLGALVFPQRGKGEWSNWGLSNGKKIRLAKGTHQLLLKLEDYNLNMDGEINSAFLDHLVLTKLAD